MSCSASRCEPFDLSVRADRWPARREPDDDLRLVGRQMLEPDEDFADAEPTRLAVLGETTVVGQPALVLRVAPYPEGGIHGGHLTRVDRLTSHAVLWAGRSACVAAAPIATSECLRKSGFDAPGDRPLSDGLVTALTEVSALRDVLMHRAGRVDLRAMREAPTLPYQRGQLVRVSRDDYRRYSSAIRCYASEISFRGIRSWPEVSDERDGPDLDRWDQYYLIGT